MNKKVTIYDLAEKTGFSVGTVNRALSGKPRISNSTRELILKTAEEMGYKANMAAQGLRRNPIKLGTILFCPVKEYSDGIIEGIVSSAIDLEKYNVSVDIDNIEYTTEVECCRLALEKMRYYQENKYNGIILFLSINFFETAEIVKMIAKLREEGIYVATVGNDIPESDRSVFVGIDAFMAGMISAELLGNLCPKGNVAILTYGSDSSINRKYLQGFDNYANDSVFSNVKIYSHFDNPKLVVSETDRMLKENPKLDGIYITSASSTIACKRIIEHNRKNLKIITTDILKDTPYLLENGIATATIFQNPFRQGRDVTKKLYSHIINPSENEEHLIAPLIIVKSNIYAYNDFRNNT